MAGMPFYVIGEGLMNAMTATMVGLTAILLFVTIPRIWAEWSRFRLIADEGSDDEMEILFSVEKAWVERHFVCAFFGIILVAAIKNDPGLHGFDDVAVAVGVYVAISCILAIAESVFAQKIERTLQVSRAAKKTMQRV